MHNILLSSHFCLHEFTESRTARKHGIENSPSIDYDQLILYPNFIHVSFVSSKANRHKIMTANGRGLYRTISKDVALTIV